MDSMFDSLLLLFWQVLCLFSAVARSVIIC